MAAIRTVTVLGTGTMGQGIAQVTASAGMATRMVDAAPGRAEQAVAAVGAQLEKMVAKGKMAADQRDAALAALKVATDVRSACEGVDLVIEAVPENLELKVKLLTEVVAIAPPHALMGSNTSSLSLTELGARIGAAERTVGLHFFNPPLLMELVEVVPLRFPAES